MVANGFTSFYQDDKHYHYGEYKTIEKHPKVVDLTELRKKGRVIKKNSGARLLDLGDDVLLLEFTSPNNTIGLDVIQMLNIAIDEVETKYKGLVIGNQGKTSVLVRTLL